MVDLFDDRLEITSPGGLPKGLKEDPDLSASDIASEIGITTRAVEKQLSKLKSSGKLKRVGPDKGGKWKVIGKI